MTIPELVRTAWASASTSTYRGSDMRGGTDGARSRLAPQNAWAANNLVELTKVLGVLEEIQQDFNQSQSAGKKVSLADLIVIAGNAAVEEAAKKGGHSLEIPFTPGRMDASQELTDVQSFAWLEPAADAFRDCYSDASHASPAVMLVEKADLLTLTVPEMRVLVGGMRALKANAGQAGHGVLTKNPGTLTNNFFVNLLDMSTKWSKSGEFPGMYDGLDRASDELKWTATSVDLIFGSNSELRPLTEVYASNDSKEKFVKDFGAAWTKVMNLGRFEPVAPAGGAIAQR